MVVVLVVMVVVVVIEVVVVVVVVRGQEDASNAQSWEQEEGQKVANGGDFLAFPGVC